MTGFSTLFMLAAAALLWPLAALAGAQVPLTPAQAGARYGQALGAVEICPGWTTTARADELSRNFTGDDLVAFKSQTAKILDAWIAVRNCVRQQDPNECKVIMDKSCSSAVAEIGPNGSSVPGLIAPPKK